MWTLGRKCLNATVALYMVGMPMFDGVRPQELDPVTKTVQVAVDALTMNALRDATRTVQSPFAGMRDQHILHSVARDLHLAQR